MNLDPGFYRILFFYFSLTASDKYYNNINSINVLTQLQLCVLKYNYYELSGTYEEKLDKALKLINNQTFEQKINIIYEIKTFKYNDLFKSLYLDLYIFSKCEISLLLLFITITINSHP